MVLVSLHWWVGVPSLYLVCNHCLASSNWWDSGRWVGVGCFRWVWHLQVVEYILHVGLHCWVVVPSMGMGSKVDWSSSGMGSGCWVWGWCGGHLWVA